MSTILSLIGIAGSFFLMKYRQQAGDMIGEADWMRKVGGVYNVMILTSLFLFFWCVATLTGTTNFFFGWVRYLIPGAQQVAPPPAPGGI